MEVTRTRRIDWYMLHSISTIHATLHEGTTSSLIPVRLVLITTRGLISPHGPPGISCAGPQRGSVGAIRGGQDCTKHKTKKELCYAMIFHHGNCMKDMHECMLAGVLGRATLADCSRLHWMAISDIVGIFQGLLCLSCLIQSLSTDWVFCTNDHLLWC
jgi:hypothetical protein